MSNPTRWRITGTFTTTAPMHVGSGAVVEDRRLLNEKNDTTCDVQAVTTDYLDRPCIPGTAVKGVLRAWAEQCFPCDPAIDRVFGKRDSGQATAEAGRAEFHTAFVVPPTPSQVAEFVKHVPFWPEEPRRERTSFTGIASSVSINRDTGAAAQNKLFFHEFVPEGVTFTVEVTLARATAEDVSFLLAVLEHGAMHATHPYQFGASGADGWGRVTWQATAVTAWDGTTKLVAPNIGFAVCTATPPLPPNPAPTVTPDCRQFTLTLAFAGPFLVNDTSRTHRVENDGKPHFSPLKRANGGVWLPASSFRGVLRSRAEFLAASCGWPAAWVEEVFGTTSKASRLTVAEFEEVGRCKSDCHQDFVAIDRFTGGAADGAKFHANYADRPTVRTTLVLDTAIKLTEGEKKRPDKDELLVAKNKLLAEAERLFALALRDVCRGEVTFGFGGSKGYGVATGTLCEHGDAWLQRHASETNPALGEAAAPTRPAPSESLTADTLTVEPSNPGFFNYYLNSQQGGKKPVRADYKQVSQDLIGQAGPEIPVEFAKEGDKPVRIRHRGKPYIPAPSQPKATAPSVTQTARLSSTHFAHPYYFLRMDDRENFTGELNDAEPPTHAKYLHDRYSGTLRVRLTTKTPLLLCDTDSAAVEECTQNDRPLGQKKGHKTFRLLTDRDGRPLLAASSVRGMLRSAYEAVTNSRFGVFPFDEAKGSGNARKLGYRPTAKSGLATVPVRIESHDGSLRARLLSGTSRINSDGRPSKDDPMCAAWVGLYNRDWNVPSANALTHGAAGWAFVGPWEHQRGFRYWNVEAVRLGATPPSGEPNAFRPARQRAWPAEWAEPRWVQGWMCVTHRNIDGKHDERFFFDTGEPRYADLSPTASSDYSRLIEDYQAEHADELSRGITRPPALKDFCRFSRHITHDSRVVAPSERILSDGTLAYAALRSDGSRWVVAALFPVMISRKLYDFAPRDLLPAKLRPPTALTELSPADRVFGWVNQQKATSAVGAPAHRSLVRVGPVTCLTPTEQAIRTFDPPVPLAILGQPKPAQGRFYLGKADGTAQAAGINKEQAGYTRTADEKRRNRIRGPKVYPHHQSGLAEGHWKGPEKTNQNRSIRGWANENTTFEFDLKLTNLSRVELGAIVWLLDLPAEHFMRLGLGKPLGFGSVKAEVVRDESCVADERAWAAAVTTGGRPTGIDLNTMKGTFEGAIRAAHPTLLDAFLKSAGGMPGLKVCYPQIGNEVEHYEWFVANERESRDGNGRKMSLPDLVGLAQGHDPALPKDPS